MLQYLGYIKRQESGLIKTYRMIPQIIQNQAYGVQRKTDVKIDPESISSMIRDHSTTRQRPKHRPRKNSQVQYRLDFPTVFIGHEFRSSSKAVNALGNAAVQSRDSSQSMHSRELLGSRPKTSNNRRGDDGRDVLG